MAVAQHRDSCANRTHVASLSNSTRLNHWVIVSHHSTKKNCIWLVVSRNLEPLFCMQDCRSWIAQVEYQSQTRYSSRIYCNFWTQTFDQYMLSHLIPFGFNFGNEIFSLCTILLNAHGATHELIDVEKVSTENLKFRTDLRDRVTDCYSVSQ